MTTQISAAMAAADMATQAELDAAIAAEVTARNAAIAAGNVKLSGDLVQSVHAQTGAVATGTTVIPFDDTIPQITEGNEYLTATITPTSAANILEIEAMLILTNSAGGFYMSAALFQDATANALAATSEYASAGAVPLVLFLRYRMTAGTTSATTFRVRAGASAAGTTTFNGSGGVRLFGGVASSSITVRELKA